LNIHATLLKEAAAAATAHQHHGGGTLYVVATPIGNLADITLRAIHVLGLVQAVACEDTRVTAPLMRHLGLDKPLVALHAHNEHAAAAGIVSRLLSGESVAYVSDAGTPGISDPGATLVAAAHAAGLRVVPVAGPSSAIAALSAAGDDSTGGFCFVGFLPAKGAERATALATVLAARATQVLFEAPHRIEALAAALAQGAPTRRITVCRELSKQFESVNVMNAADWPAWLAADPQRHRGEFVLVLHALPQAVVSEDSLPPAAERVLTILLASLPLKQAVALAAEISGAPRNALYTRALQLRPG
jgi:16S rRNA (cytidine1402-2'-O)-methyltransferase